MLLEQTKYNWNLLPKFRNTGNIAESAGGESFKIDELKNGWMVNFENIEQVVW